MPLINNSIRYFSEISQQFISGPLCHPTFVGFRYIFYSSHSSGAGAPAQWATICRPLSVGFRLRLRLRRDRLISARQWLAGRLTSALQLNYHLSTGIFNRALFKNNVRQKNNTACHGEGCIHADKEHGC